MAKKILFIVSIYFLYSIFLYSETIIIKTKSIHSSYKIDIPKEWSRIPLRVENLDLMRFSDVAYKSSGEIEVRSDTFKDQLNFNQLMSKMISWLSTKYSFVRLISEEKSMFRKNGYIAQWKIKNNNKVLKAKSLILVNKEKVLFLICTSTQEQFDSYEVVFENAIYSLDFVK